MGLESLSKRERMMCACRNGVPDRVPCCPDISYMVPIRKTGKPFYQVLLMNDPPLWKAYLDAIRYFDMEGWFTYGVMPPVFRNCAYTVRAENGKDAKGRHVQTLVFSTPKGDLVQKTTYPDDECDTPTEKMIKNFVEDFPKIRYLFPEIERVDTTLYREQKRALGEDGMMAIGCFPPGFHIFNSYFAGNLEAVTFAYYDYPELFAEFISIYEKYTLRHLECMLDEKPDSILTGGSGSITMQSPDLFDEITFPTIQKITQMCYEAGVISGIHSCGKERHVIERCAAETHLNYINPLELPPMGDCTIAEMHNIAGDRLALMGNLHTTNTMLRGSVEEVRLCSLQALLAGAVQGGFILSTGDQCGRDTPDENIQEMVRVCKEFGQYPLNVTAIRDEISRLQKKLAKADQVTV